jgi:hypothetical protein
MRQLSRLTNREVACILRRNPLSLNDNKKSIVLYTTGLNSSNNKLLRDCLSNHEMVDVAHRRNPSVRCAGFQSRWKWRIDLALRSLAFGNRADVG